VLPTGQTLVVSPTTAPGAAAPVIIRLAEAGDLPQLVVLLAHGSLEVGKEDPGDLAPYRAALAEILGTPGNDIVVAEAGGTAVGLCQVMLLRRLASRGGLCAEIESMHVHPDWRGRGIGGLLVEAAVARADAAGCFRVQLTSNLARTDAHRFYERHGFTATHAGFKRPLR
jgi:GNAT superfamily N-acetyltransferase